MNTVETHSNRLRSASLIVMGRKLNKSKMKKNCLSSISRFQLQEQH